MDTWIEMLHLTNRALEAAPLLPFASVWTRKQHLPARFQLMLYYIGIEVVLYLLSAPSRAIFRNDVYIYHLSTIFAVIFIGQTYRRLFVSNKIKRLTLILIYVFLAVAFLDACLLNGLFTNLNSYSQAFGSIILVSLALLHIIRVSRNNMYLENQPDFFFSIAILIYFSYSIVTYVATNIIYNSGYDYATTVRLDDIISSPDAVLFATQMGLFTWMFSFFPLDIAPLRALPYWLHYSRWHPRPYKLLGQNALSLRRLTTAGK